MRLALFDFCDFAVSMYGQRVIVEVFGRIC
jgi:hypothetical protein